MATASTLNPVATVGLATGATCFLPLLSSILILFGLVSRSLLERASERSFTDSDYWPAVVPIVCDESTLQHVGIGVSCLADLTDLGILRNSASPAAKLPAA
jgi:hypothetical protein